MATPRVLIIEAGSGEQLAIGVPAPVAPEPEITLTAASPASGTVGVQSGDMTVAWTDLPEAITITPAVAPGPGTLSPASISAGPGSGSAALRLTPLAAAAHLVSLANDGGIANPPAVGYSASAAPAAPPTTATLSGSNASTTGAPHLSAVTLDHPADQTYTITWARSDGGTGPATSTITAGQTSVSAASTWAAAGSGRTVDFTISPSLTRAGRPLSVNVSEAGALPALTLLTAGAGTYPWTAGQAFRQGDLPTPSLVGLQCDAKTYWPDGSVKFALLSGSLVATGSSSTVALTAGAGLGGAALTTADLKATGIAAAIGCGAYGTATWAAGSADWDAPFMAWIEGPAMSSWIYRKAVGSDAHLVAWLEVRLYAGGAVEVLPWIENGYLTVAGPTSKAATFTFSLGGSQRFSGAIDLPARCRTPLVSGSALSHWLGSDPGVTPIHGTVYLQQTGMVPAYQPVTPDASLYTSLPSTFTPLQQGMYRDTMSATGYHPSIGLLPQWDVLHLLTPTAQTLGGVIRQGYSAGRYASHYRDEATNRPIRLSQRSTDTVNTAGVAGGTAAPVYDTGHHPSMGFMAYLLTGRFYFMEEVQFVATYNYLRQSADVVNVRQGASGIFQSASGDCTVRGASWCNRTLLQAVLASPDGDAVGADLKASLEANIAWNHARYVAQANNPYGLVEPYSSSYGSANGHQIDAPWQQDFYTAAFGYMLAAQPSISGTALTKLSEFFAWKAQWIVGRLGAAGASNYLYADAAQYNLEVCATGADFGTGAGPWPASWATIYGWNFGTSNTTDPGLLRGGNFPGAASYWGNLRPAIAYAVKHGVSGAQAAYNRLLAASNAPTQLADFATAPEWAVQPVYAALAPSWVGPVGQWTAIASSTLSATSGVPWTGTSPGGSANYAAVFSQWSGGFVAEQGVWAQGTFYPGKHLCAWGGGHVDYAGNEMYAFGPLESDTPAWRRVMDPTIPAAQNVGRTAGGYPVARHSYDTLQYMPETNQMLAIGAAGYYSLGYVIQQGDVFDFSINPQSANPWTTADTGYPAYDGGGYGSINLLSARDPASGSIWGLGQGNAQRIGRYTTAGVWSSWYIDNAPGATNSKAAIGRGLFVFVNNAGAVVAIDISGTSPGALYTPTVTGSGPSGGGVCVEWDAVGSRFIAWKDGGGKTLYFLTPGANAAAGGDPWAWSSVTPVAGDTPAANGLTNGQFGRFRIVQAGTARVVVLNTGHNQPVCTYRLS